MKSGKNSSQQPYKLLRRIRRSIFPEPLIPLTESDRKGYLVKNLILHFRPPTVPRETLRFSLTWGLGGMAVVLVLLQLGTGLLLKFTFEPTPMGAYESIRSLQSNVPFGWLVRNLHHWCANLLVLIAFLHMLRVFLTGAFQPPRQFNWIIGLTMFAIVLAANLTGYLLPYDQLAYWAVTVSTGMLEYVPIVGPRMQEMIRGGDEIGGATLRIFFALHTALIPGLLLVLMGFHFWRVRKAGGLVIPRLPDEPLVTNPVRVSVLPNLLLREVVTALVLVASVLLLAVFLDAPLGDPANPGLSPNPTKAPWYFAGLQELLLHVHPTFAVFVIPLCIVIALMALPYLNYDTDTRGIWFASDRGRRTALVAGITALIITPLLIVLDEAILGAVIFSSASLPLISQGLIPTLLLTAGVLGFYAIIKRRFSATNNEAIQACFVLLITVLVVMTIVGVWFRGAGMALGLPWTN
jgi:quinol-cytochrome oxidoreductase complex cytochrome b subunit